jgi:hypothetical protein
MEGSEKEKLDQRKNGKGSSLLTFKTSQRPSNKIHNDKDKAIVVMFKALTNIFNNN